MGFSVAVFLFLMNARAGVLSADDEYRRVCLTLGASKVQMFWKLYVPVALPAIRWSRPRDERSVIGQADFPALYDTLHADLG